MQKMVLIKNGHLKEINQYLDEGWKIKMIQPVNSRDSSITLSAYAVIEK